MRSKLTAALAGVALVAAPLGVSAGPAAAVAGTRVVAGHDLAPAGLREFRDSCTDLTTQSPPEASRLVRQVGSAGSSHSIGWQPPAGYEAGALATVSRPDTLSTFAADVWAPNGAGTGNAVVFYYSNEPGYTAGYWVGFESITVPSGGFGTVNLADKYFLWSYFEPGYSEINEYSDTISHFAQASGGPGRGAYVGVLAGCEGQPYYVDNLRVADAADQLVYDFEGYASASRLQWWDGKKARADDFTADYRTKFVLLGDSYDAASLAYYTAPGTLYQKPYGASGFTPVATAAFDTENYAVFKVRPDRETTYWFSTGGSDVYDSSASDTLTVGVGVGVSGRLVDGSIKPGQRAVVRGKLKPGNRGVKIAVQQRLGSRWVTVEQGRSGKGGRFTVGVRAGRPGTMVLRLAVKGGQGNLATRTNSVRVQVKARPKPEPSGGGGGQNGSSGGGYTPPVETSSSSPASNTPPGPDDESHRFVAKPRPQVVVPDVAAQAPPCYLPGLYALAPCAPGTD